MRKILLTVFVALTACSLSAQTIVKTYQAPSSVSIDNVGNYGYNMPGVSFSSSDFGVGCRISDVNVTVEWAKTDGSCTSPTGGLSWHEETSFRIDGPTGNDQVLALPGTWSGNTTTSSVVTTFNQSIAAIPSGTPSSGSFKPNNGNLNTYNGTSPYGTWNLRAGDNGAADPLCVTYYSVEITTAADVTGPTVSGASNITLNNTSGSCGRNVSFSLSATDACGVSGGVSASPASGSFFPVGTTPVSYLANDIYGNSTSGSFVVTINDNQNPVITCPSNVSVNAANGACSAAVTYSTPTATDNCSASVSRTVGPASGSNFSVGSTTVTHVATDPSSNTATCSFTVTVVDTQDPAISCPASFSLNAVGGTCAAPVPYSVPTATDNCPGVIVARIAGPASGGSFPVGPTTVTHRATDAVGRTAICSFTVTIVDAEAPVITGCPTDITVSNDAGQCNAVASWTAPTASDNCSGVSIARTTGPGPGSTFSLGTTGVVYTATDVAGNDVLCSFDVIVQDNENPTISCPSDIVVNNDPGFCSAEVSYGSVAFGDNCPGVTLLQTVGLPSGSAFGVNTSPNTVTFTATDNVGNQQSCSFTVTVNDNENPTIVCPLDIVVDSNVDECEATVNWIAPVGADNCPGLSTVQTVGVASGSVFAVNGNSTPATITYEVTDASSHTASCSFTVTVEDNQFPAVTCPASQVTTFPNCQYSLGDNTAGAATDNCPGLAVVQTPAPGIITGETEVQLAATDASGNVSVCTFTLTPFDNTPPTFDSCPTVNDSVSVNSSCQFFMPDYSSLDVSDVCNATLTITQNPIVGTPLTSTTPVTVSVSDGTNVTTCVFNVAPRDDIAPSVICPADRVEPANPSCQFTLVDYTGLASVVVSDNCPGTPAVTQPSIGNTISGSGIVTLYATDVSGNVGTCTFEVTVDDNTLPVITCPNNQTVFYNANCIYSMADFTSSASSSDNCPGIVSLVQTPSAGTSISGVSSQVTIEGADAAGNVGSCQFTLTIEDNSAPSIACPQTQQVDVDSSCEYDLANFTSLATSSDGCSAVTLTQLPAIGSTYNFTATPTVSVTLYATDVDANVDSCSFQVLLNDVTGPTITCGADVSVLFGSNCSVVVGSRISNYVGALSVMDNCDSAPIITQSPASNVVVQGQTTVTLTATDASGNTGTCDFELIPNDSEAPTVDVCPSSAIDINLDGSCDYTLADYTGLATFSDNCDLSLTITQNPGVGSVVGTQAQSTVTITALDDAGNSNFCNITINPIDVTPPTLVCPLNQTENFDAGCAFVLTDYTSMATATDNCDLSVLVTQSPVATTSVSGSTVITITATDGVNSSQCTFSVIPNDNTAPTITCPVDQDVSFNSSCQFNMVDYTALATGVTDNCDDASDVVISQSFAVGTSVGDTSTVVLTATDLSGNSTTCNFDVNPSDNTNPTISCPQNQTVSVGSNCLYDLIDYTGQAVADDFCDATVSVTQSPLPTTGITLATVTTVILTATDDASNLSTCTLTVSAIDDTAPTISCPTDTLVSTDASCQYVMIDETTNHELVVSDNCDSSPTVTQSPVSGTILTGSTTITLTVEDAAGNTGNCTYLYTLEDQVDPTIACPADQLISSNSSCDYIIPDFSNSALIDDNCTAALTVTQNPLPLINTIVVDTVITLIVTDGAGNTDDCSFLITADDNALPNILCPGDQLVNFNLDCEYELLDFRSLATATDNCGSPTITQTQPVDSIITGTTTIELIAVDADLNEASCTFDVIPSDIGAPDVTCAQPAITVASGGQCSFTMDDYTGPAYVSATDNCGSSFTFSQSPVAGTLVGSSTVVTLSTTDPSGNVGTCTMTVTPEDNTAPVLFCPTNVTVSLDGSCEFDLPDYSPLVFVTDNCDSAPFTIVQTPAATTIVSGATATTVEFSVMDGAGNTGDCSFIVTTIDDDAPSISCPVDAIVSANASCEFTLADYEGSVSSSDNCTVPTLVQTPASGGDYSGNVVVTVVATDGAGNTNSCSFNVTPEDDTDPSLTCPPNQTPNFTANCEFTVPDYTALAAFSDFCDNTPFVTQSPGIGTIVSGNTTVTITVVDNSGNTSTCQFDLDPEDHQAPVVDCPTDFAVSLSPSCDFAVVDYTSLVTVSDNCDGSPSLVQTPSSGTLSGAGTVTSISITAMDAGGNTGNCTFSITLEDNTDPVLVDCPANQTVPLSANCQFIVANYTGAPLSITDNCDPSAGVTQSPLAGSLIGGSTVVTLSAEDANGNIGTCTFTVTPDDNDPPTIFDCSPDITVNNDLGVCGAVVTYPTITATDNCAGVVVPQLTNGLASGSVFPVVPFTTVIYVADDGNGNTTTCEFDVTVIDNENPIIICPVDIAVNIDAGTCGADVTYSLPTVTDNCTGGIIPTLDAGLASASTFSIGVNTVTYGADDGNGNTSSCSFNITVTDNELPVITCPLDITVDNDFGNCDAVVTYVLPTVSDNCPSLVGPTLVLGGAPNTVFVLGTTTVTYMVEDAAGNTNDCSFDVTVEDNEDPVLTCPADISVFVDTTTCQAVVTYLDATVADNCNQSIVPTLQTGPASGDSFPLGDTTVVYTAADGNGNSTTCSFMVTVVDNEVPSIVCPGNQVEAFDPICQLVLPDYTSLGVTQDNCDGAPIITQSPAAATLVTGVTTVTLTSTDFAGNSSDCSFDIIDNTPPVVNCIADQTVGSDINCEFELLDYSLVTVVTDNCGATTLTQTPVSGTFVSVQTTVTLTAEDQFGNASSCDFEIIPVDNISPSITCIGNQVAVFDNNCEYELPDYTGQANADDNCDSNPTITQSPASGNMIAGTATITLTAEDDNGNTISCTFDVIPSDNTSPTVDCPVDQLVSFDANCEFALQDYTGLAVSTDNCSSVMTITQVPAVSSTQSANTVVTLTAEDDNGNTSSCAFVVMPSDDINPVVTCPADITVDFDANCQYTLTDYTSMATATDNCSNSILISQLPTVGSVVPSTELITLTADDGNGNSGTCTFSVIPTDNTAPTIICASDQTVTFNADCEYELLDYVGFATTSDNCSNSILMTQSPTAGTFISGPGVMILTADDGNGNTATCSFNVIPEDNDSPSIDCPVDQNVSFDANCAYTLLDYTSMAVIADNCSGTVTVTQDITLGTIITGTTVVTLTADDGAGNTADCSFSIVASDNTNPSVTCPTDIDVDLDENCEYILLDYTLMASSSDNCGISSVAQSELEGAVITTSTQIIIAVGDNNGNTSSCSFFVNPADNEAPTVVCPDNQLVILDANCQFELPDFASVIVAEDNCSTTFTSSQFPPASTVILTATAVTITINDGNGNSTDCTFGVTPEDDTAPIITACPPDQSLSLDANCEVIVPDFSSMLGAVDNCDFSLENGQLPEAGSILTVTGVEVITVVAYDDAENVNGCQFNLTITDDTNPVVDCPVDQVLELNANCEFEVPDYSQLSTGTDACGSVTLTQSPLAGSVITGQLNATVIAEDESGNTATCTFFVTPVEMEVVVTGTSATCQGGTGGTASVSTTGGTEPYVEDWGGFNPDVLAAGTYAVTVTDANGCSALGEITIEDGELFQIEVTPAGPVQICEGETVQLDAGSGYAQYAWSTNASVQVITVSAAADYWVTVTNADGCSSNTDTVEVSFYTAVVPSVSVGSDGMLVCSNDSATNYQWSFNGTVIPNETEYTYCPTQSGNYVVQMIDANGCLVNSFTVEYTFDESSPCAIGIDEFGLSLDVYPNPSTGVFEITYSLATETKLELGVFDIVGNRVVTDIQMDALVGRGVIDLSNQAEGVYILRIELGTDRVLQQRLVLVK